MYGRMYWINFNRSSYIEACLFKSQTEATCPGEKIYCYWPFFHGFCFVNWSCL